MSIAIVPALAVLLGAALGIHGDVPRGWRWWLVPILLLAAAAWRRHRLRCLAAVTACGFALAAALLASATRDDALDSRLRHLLTTEDPGFAFDALRVEGVVPPIDSRLRLLEDAAVLDDAVSLRAEVLAVRIGDIWRSVPGEDVRISVGGDLSGAAVDDWRAGRRLSAPVAYRRPARFLNEGVPDFERDLALDGTVLLGSVKSALLIADVQRASWPAEIAASVRAHVRRVVATHVTPHRTTAGAVVTAVLIGDRTGLPDEDRTRLQAAGTYHVIAISGGNIAILAGVLLGILWPLGIRGRPAAAATFLLLAAYAAIVTTGPSVWRATLMAMLYLLSRMLDHRSAPWHTMALVAAVMVLVAPLDIRNPGFVLTFGATAALIEGGRRAARVLARARSPSGTGAWGRATAAGFGWVLASIAASLAVELALAPVSAQLFSRVTGAGVLLNLISVPAMTIVQIGGMVVCLPVPEVAARAAGWAAAQAAGVLLDSARLVDLVPAVSRRVPPPGVPLLLIYYVALGIAAGSARRPYLRVSAAIMALLALGCVVTGWPSSGARTPADAASELRLTMLDVGQAEALLIESPGGGPVLVDAAGIPFGGGGLDIGARVIAPALWAFGVRRLDGLVVTHGDPDHLGGGVSVLRDFAPPRVWMGVDVPAHRPWKELEAVASVQRASIAALRRGDQWRWGAASVRVLHPPEPDWERQRVRNDDSVVLEIRFGEVAMLLTGDVGAEVEQELLMQLTDAPIRILKVAHHGSRTSTSAALLEAWRPHIALISCGRNNNFGHPAAEVIGRLQAIGTRIYRTDLDGQIVLTTDGGSVRVRTWMEERPPS